EAAERASDPARPNRPRIALAPHAAARLLGAATGAGAGGGGRGDRATTAVSTLDASVQRAASDALERNLRALADRNVHDGAAIALDNRTGEVLAWVGAAGALASARHVDGVLAHRQAGSTLKPFLYGVAFDERRLTAASLVEDLPLALPVSGGLYRPRNYDEGYRGLVSARSALAGSLNVPAVRVLELVGVERLARVLRALGFAAVDRPGEHYGPALALGAARALRRSGLRRRRRALRSREPRRDLRAREPARHALLGRRQDRDQQGHARQLVRRLLDPLHGRRLGRERVGRAHARRERGVGRGTGVARDPELPPPRRAGRSPDGARAPAHRGAGRR